MLHTEKTELHFGLEHPIRILHLTDVHLSFADDTDGDSMKRHAEGRREAFWKSAGEPEQTPEEYLREAMEYGSNFDATVITGDVLDFTSHANQIKAKEILEPYDYLFCAGNHEFSQRVGKPDSFDYRNQIFGQIQSNFHGNMTFDSRIVGGVNLIAVDNSYYVWSEEQFKHLRAETERGYPCVLFCHVPLLDTFLNHAPSHPDLPVDEETVRLTRSVTQFIIGSPAIQAVFAGHYHQSGQQELPGGKICHILGGLYRGIVGEIDID